MTLLWIVGSVWVGSAAILSLALCAASRKIPPAIDELQTSIHGNDDPNAGHDFDLQRAA